MSKFSVGDYVEATKGRDGVKGVVRLSGQVLVVGASCRSVDGLEAQGWTVTVLEKAAPPVPTEPGYYFDKDGDMWNERNDTVIGLDPRYAPYTRLEPVPVTVQKVIDKLADGGIIRRGGEVARAIREIFGVTS